MMETCILIWLQKFSVPQQLFEKEEKKEILKKTGQKLKFAPDPENAHNYLCIAVKH